METTARLQRSHNLDLLIQPFRRYKNLNGLSYGFTLGVSEDALRTLIPTLDNTVQGHRTNRIFRRFHDRGVPDSALFLSVMSSTIASTSGEGLPFNKEMLRFPQTSEPSRRK